MDVNVITVVFVNVWIYLKKFLKSVWAFLKFLAQPLKVIRLHKISFFLWTSFTLFGGLIGIVISVIRYAYFGDYSFLQAIYIESLNGSFYTYSIAIVAAVLSGVFIIFAEKDTLSFRRYQIPFITISIFLMFFGGVFYALAKQSEVVSVNKIPNTDEIVIEWKQFSIFLLSVLFSIYSFCVCRLDDHKPYFSDISDNRDKNKPVPQQIPNTINQGTTPDA